MNKIRKGDEVIVLTGKDKGKRGSVLNILEGKILVEGVNRVRKATKPNPAKGTAGGLVDKDMPLDQSNIALFNRGTGRGDRVGIRTLEDGRKVRFFKSNGEVVDA
ncbi:MAG: 50S ribosomal protein L24 [Betaproteobacteria bacterium]|nr:MAG: 50S ribosomal protein L24 [Betaproteobacteria bacterium]